MERCSFFIKGKALFGSFPTQEAINELEENGVRHFVDLTGHRERKTVPYVTKYQYIKYPISDHDVPKDIKSFSQLILEICKIIRHLRDNEKIYIHCKGGHGRSGILVACILCYYNHTTPDIALKETSRYHSLRPFMRERWRRLGSPQSKRQKDFVKSFFRPLRYGKYPSNTRSIGFDNSSPHAVTTELGRFPNAYLAFQAYRDPHNKEYIHSLQQGKETVCQKQRSDWGENKKRFMMIILESKFREHNSLRYSLLRTGLQPLIRYSRDAFWGDGNNGQGKNIHGKILSALRERFMYEDMLNSRT